MQKPRIQPHATLPQVLLALSDGNVGALSVLVRLIKEGDNLDPDSIAGGLGALMTLDQAGLHGAAIWMVYKDRCDQDLATFMGLLRAVQLGFLSEQALREMADGPAGVDPVAVLHAVQARLSGFGQAGAQ